MTTLAALIEAARPRQWTKNGLLFVGLLFALRLMDTLALARAGTAFVAFCAISSAGYIFNDLADLDQDRLHPRKRRRPLASGRLPRGLAIGFGVLLLAIGVGLAFTLSRAFGALAVGYVTLSVAYNLGLKRVVLVDLFTLASFFVIRTVAGAVAIDVPISPWLYLCTILAALFLGLAKRRHELLLLGDSAGGHRQILREYTPQLLEQLITIVTASLIMAYSLYTFSAENLPRDHTMMVTIPIVIFGIFRYLYLVHLRDGGGAPEDLLLSDRPLIVTVVLLLVGAVAVLYTHIPGAA